MNEKYKILSNNVAPVVGDGLISKPYLYFYFPENLESIINDKGIPSLQELQKIEPYSQIESDIIKRYSQCVPLFITRIPDDVQNKTVYKDMYTCRVILSRLDRAGDNHDIIPFNFKTKHELNTDTILKLCKQKDLLCEKFRNSTDKLLFDCPMCFINCPAGSLPSFCCKILKDAKNKLI